MRIDIVTLFPELFSTFTATSLIGRAVDENIATIRTWQLRDFGSGKHKSVDDTPYGGGSGMVLRVDVMAACLEAVDADGTSLAAHPGSLPAPADSSSAPADSPVGARFIAPSTTDKTVAPREEAQALGAAHRILLTPQGAPLTQRIAERLSVLPRLALICGRYEGFDERVRGLCHEEISLGDFVMTGGEVCAMAVIEATVRLLPGVLGNAESAREESHSAEGLLEYPHYTRPLEFRGARVPEVLTSGNHAKIAAWRREESLRRTAARRPDLLARHEDR